MKITVSSAAHQHTTDIDPTFVMDAREWDRLGNVCVARATTALEKDLSGYKKEHRDHLSDMFKSMAATKLGNMVAFPRPRRLLSSLLATEESPTAK